MPITINTAAKDVILDGFDTMFNGGTIEIREGSSPGAGAAATGTVLSTIALPVDAFAAAAGGQKAKQGTWQDSSADATGTAGYYRMRSADGTKVIDGNITLTGGGGAMTLDTLSFVTGQTFTITSFVFTV